MNDYYKSIFGGIRLIDQEKCDYALIARDEKNVYGFVTCIEMDGDTVYWQFGGATIEKKKSVTVSRAYKMFIEHCKGRYQRISTRIENTNTAMLKLALANGFIVQGVWMFKQKVYVELCLEFGG